MVIFAKCKINLGLRVVEKRKDGFHNLETIFVSVPSLCDIIEIKKSDSVSLKVYDAKIDCSDADNLVLKAYNLIEREYDISPVNIGLVKRIPFGAGLGGGSSDAAATLILLNTMFNLNIPFEKLESYALSLGSDVPFFLYANRVLGSEKDNDEVVCMYAKGRGEVLSPIALPQLSSYEIRIEKPEVSVSTAMAYKSVIPKVPSILLTEIVRQSVDCWRDLLINQFEDSVFESYPIIKSYKERMYSSGASFSLMSGSGSAVFGLFKK